MICECDLRSGAAACHAMTHLYVAAACHSALEADEPLAHTCILMSNQGAQPHELGGWMASSRSAGRLQVKRDPKGVTDLEATPVEAVWAPSQRGREEQKHADGVESGLLAA